MRRRLTLLSARTSVWCTCIATAASAQTPSAIVAGRYVAPDGTLKPSAAIAIADGKISAIRAADEAGNAAARYPDAVVSPGLIDLRSSIGSYGETSASKRSIDPDVDAIDAIDWHHRDFEMALAAGVTTAMIAPAPVNLVAGAATVIKTDSSKRTVLRGEGPLVLALGPSVWRYDRAPTSRSDSLVMLRDAFDAARRAEGSQRLIAMVKGGLDSIVSCDEAMDVSEAMRLFEDVAGPNAIIYTGDQHDVANELAGRGTATVVGPYTFESRPRVLSLAGALAKHGVPVALAGEIPERGRDSLRVTAALAVRYGMEPAAARNAITAVAAKVAGVAQRVGTIEPGKDADFVVFSGDPLRLESRVLAVYINGMRVYADHEALAGSRDDE